jgi:hypothetical protein
MSDILLSWVLPDPNRERSVDPLGTGAFAERIADQLVPGFSGTTTRARYLSLLCAAVRRASSAGSPLKAIHHIEAEHAVLDRWHGVLLGKPALKLKAEETEAPILSRARLDKMRLDLSP